MRVAKSPYYQRCHVYCQYTYVCILYCVVLLMYVAHFAILVVLTEPVAVDIVKLPQFKFFKGMVFHSFPWLSSYVYDYWLWAEFGHPHSIGSSGMGTLHSTVCHCHWCVCVCVCVGVGVWHREWDGGELGALGWGHGTGHGTYRLSVRAIHQINSDLIAYVLTHCFDGRHLLKPYLIIGIVCCRSWLSLQNMWKLLHNHSRMLCTSAMHRPMMHMTT